MGVISDLANWFSWSSTFNSARDLLESLPDPEIPDVKARGASQNDVFGEAQYSEWNPEYAWPANIRLYDEMRNDPIIAEVLRIITMPILGAERKIVPADSSKESTLAAARLQENIEMMEWQGSTGIWHIQKFSDVINNALLSLVYGFAMDEVVFRFRGPRVLIAKIAPRMPHSINRFIVNPEDTSDLIAVEQVNNNDPSAQVYNLIPSWKVTQYIFQAEGDSFVGKSLLRSMVRPYYYGTRIEQAQAVGLEHSIMGVPVIFSEDREASMTEAELQAAKLAVGNIRVGERLGLVLPPGFQFEFGTTQVQDVTNLLRYYDWKIASAAVQQIAIIGASGGGSYSLAETQDSVSQRFVQSVATDTAQSFNNGWIALHHYYNYGTTRTAPKFQFGDLIVPTIDEIIKQLATAVEKNVLTWQTSDEVDLRNKMQLGPLRDAEGKIIT